MASSLVVVTLWKQWSECLLTLDEMVLCPVTPINQVDATILWQMIERKRSTSWFLKITMMVLLTITLLLTQTGELLFLWHSFSSFHHMFFLRSIWRITCQSRLPVQSLVSREKDGSRQHSSWPWSPTSCFSRPRPPAGGWSKGAPGRSGEFLWVGSQALPTVM